MVELIITEKPAASKKIADALADKKAVKKNIKGVPYYELIHENKNIVVGCAVGHLFGLAEKEKKGMGFPVFDIGWRPLYEIKKGSFSKKYVDVLKKLSKKADEFTIACDYDIEGEVIGLNVLRFICKQKDGNRMKFSTLTKEDLLKAYDKKSCSIDWGQANAGETRHILDWYYGINISRALTSAIKSKGFFKIMSSGRVQGPSLKIIVDREREIKAFKPKKYWQIFMDGKKDEKEFRAIHCKNKFWEKEEAEIIYKKTGNEKKAEVMKVEKKEQKVPSPFPFDLTTLQVECYRCFGISPKETLAIAQELYTQGYISYPRTSSQILPKEIGYKKILKKLSKSKEYSKLFAILPKKLVPNNGKKKDPAHPAIYPTGIIPKNLKQKERKVYDIIVKRFFSTFGEPAIRESIKVSFNIKNEEFITKGIRTKNQGWFSLYAPYLLKEEEEIPEFKEKEITYVKKIFIEEKETKPKKRFTPASIIRELEKRGLGTKATRAQIIDTLYKRNYIVDKAIKPTELGIKTIEILEKYSPQILDEELTRHFEEEMELIRQNKKNKEEVLEEAKEVIIKIVEDFKKKEDSIGEGLKEAHKKEMRKQNTVGKCPECDGTLVIKKGKYGRFIACNNYPKCKLTFTLPSKGLVKVSSKTCKECGYPLIKIIKRGKKPKELCINPECPSKQLSREMAEKQGKVCPKCKKGKLVVRKSVYGSFLACSDYPKCNYIEKPKKKD